MPFKLLLTMILAFLFFSTANAAVPDSIKGKVFLDANGNGKMDNGEKGIAGVRVTDGVEFAVSGDDGSYGLKIGEDYIIPFRPARTVSVCWPTGKWPVGRWWFRLDDIADANAVNFGLRDDEQKLPFVFLQMSDDHGMGKMYSEHYAHDVRMMAPAVKFIFNTGDMGYATPEGAEAMFKSIASNQAAFPVPMFITPGNHDFVGEKKDANMLMNNNPIVGWGTQTKYIGPVRWSFDYAGVHFIGLDYIEKTDKDYKDMIPHVAVAFMEKDLASVPKGTRVIMLVHCYDCSNDFCQALRKFKVEFICSGHTHVPIYARIAKTPIITNYGVGTGIVTADSFDFAERKPYTFGNSSLLGYFRGITAPAMEKRRQKQHAVADKNLKNTTFKVEGAPEVESVEIVAEILPGSAKKAGFSVGKKDKIEITFDGNTVNVAGAPMPFKLIPDDIVIPAEPGAPTNAPVRRIKADRSLRWHILIDRDRLTIMGNDLFRLTKSIKVDQPAKITLLADGGDAMFKKFDAWELKTIKKVASRGLHHFPPPAWTWGGPQHVAACLDEDSDTAREILKRYSDEGIMDYE